jgi:hypothetical protein
LPKKFRHYPDWTDALHWLLVGRAIGLARCGSCLAQSFIVEEVLSDRPVDVSKTKGGYPPLLQKDHRAA